MDIIEKKMTDKQKLKSIEAKMKRIQNNNLYFDFEIATRFYSDIIKYQELKQEHFFLKFDMEHCIKCGKKL